MSKIIGFNADERLRILSDALSRRLGYQSRSAMLTAWIEKAIGENFSADEQASILTLMSPSGRSSIAESTVKYEARPKERSRRQAAK